MERGINLLKETLDSIKSMDLSPDDIIFIGSDDGLYSCTWDDYKGLANKRYDCGYGGAEVLGDLIIEFSSGHRLVRGEYDGSEWWEIHAPLVVGKDPVRITNLFAASYESRIKEMNGEGK